MFGLIRKTKETWKSAADFKRRGTEVWVCGLISTISDMLFVWSDDCLLFFPEKDGENYQAGGGLRHRGPGNWTRATFNSKAIHSKPQPKYKACQSPRSNSWAPCPFACLDMCACERMRGFFSDLCRNIHTQTYTQTTQAFGYFVLVPGGKAVPSYRCVLVSVLREFTQFILQRTTRCIRSNHNK